MIKWLILHQWKDETRSLMRSQNIAGGIVYGVMLLVLGLYMLAGGLFLYDVLQHVEPGVDPVSIINSILLYYFIFDLFLRFLLQGIPSQKIDPYRLLPVKKSVLSNFLLVVSLLSIFNLLPLLVFIPFAIEAIAIPHSVFQCIVWIGTLVFLMACNNFLSFYFKKQIIANPKIVALGAFVLAGFIACDHYNIFSLRRVSSIMFGSVMHSPILIVIPAVLCILLYLINYSFLREHSYRDDLQPLNQKKQADNQRFEFLQRFGAVGLFMALELKLMFRNKRPRSTIYFALVSALGMGLLLFGMRKQEGPIYPTPHTKAVQQGGQQQPLSSSMKQVTFRVVAPPAPPNAFVYVTGNIPELGNWEPSEIVLDRQPDSSWMKTVYIAGGTKLEFKVTLGSWQTQALTREGLTPANLVLQVAGDTTVNISVPRWKTPGGMDLQDLMLVYIGIFLTGVLIFSYGQFLLGWEGGYFDLLLSRDIDFRKYFYAKYFLMMVSGILFYVLLLPLGFFELRIVTVNTAVLIYNIGINSIVFLFIAGFNRRKLDLNASVYTNQGKGASQYLVLIPAFFVPMLIYAPISMYVSRDAGLAALAAAGILGIIFNRQLMTWDVKHFQQQKYKIAAGCKQS